MLRLPTVLLRHETRHGSHHDWLLANPHTAYLSNTSLWTSRLAPPTRHWVSLGTWQFQLIHPHRVDYLTYQGPLSPLDGQPRGQVRRADQGTFVPRLWTDHRVVIDVAMRHFQGRVEVHRLTDKHYTATVICAYD